MFRNKIIIICLIYFIIHIGGSIDNTTKLPFVSGGDLYITSSINAKDPTYNELITFLNNDTTDEHPYIKGEYMCGEFATQVHNNAESQGIRAGVVSIRYENKTVGHAINVFNTIDRGLVFIDCTSAGNPNDDKIATLTIGSKYSAVSIFNPPKITTEYKITTCQTRDGERTMNLPFTTETGYTYNYNSVISKYTITW